MSCLEKLAPGNLASFRNFILFLMAKKITNPLRVTEFLLNFPGKFQTHGVHE